MKCESNVHNVVSGKAGVAVVVTSSDRVLPPIRAPKGGMEIPLKSQIDNSAKI